MGSAANGIRPKGLAARRTRVSRVKGDNPKFFDPIGVSNEPGRIRCSSLLNYRCFLITLVVYIVQEQFATQK